MKTWHYLLVLFTVTFLIYLPSFGNKFVWDDEQFIYRNQYVQNFDISKILTTNTIAGAGEVSNYYRPITTLSFAFDKQIWNQNVIGYHFTNTLLHSLGGVMLFLLLLEIGFGKRSSFWVSLLFLLHPIQTEAVVYINSRGDSWYVLLALTAIYLLARVINQKPIKFNIYDSKFSLNSWLLAALSSVFFLLSVLGKEIGIASLGLLITTSFVMLVNKYKSKHCKFKKILKEQRTAIISLSISLLLAVSYLMARATFLNFSNSFNFYSAENIYASNLLIRLLTFTKIFFIYLRLLIVPYPLHMERYTDLVINFSSVWPWLFITFNLGLAALSWYEWRRKKTLTILYGWSWFFIMLAPVSGIIPINGLLYEHWLYLPMVGLLLVLVGIISLFPSQIYASISKYISLFLIFIALTYSVLTIRQNYLWGNPVRFYFYLLQHTESARIHNNLAMALSDDGQLEQALAEYQAAIDSGANYPQVYYNRANTYHDLKNFEQAVADYTQAISIDPNFYYAYNSLISLLSDQGEYEQALQVVNQAEAQFTDIVDYKLMKIQLLTKLGQTDQAIELIDQLETQISNPQVRQLIQKWKQEILAVDQTQ